MATTTAQSVDSQVKADKPMQIHAPVAIVELLASAGVFFCIILVGLKNVYDKATEASTEILYHELVPDEARGRFVLEHYQDVTDIEVQAFATYWFPFIMCCLANTSVTWLLAVFDLRYFRRYSGFFLGLIGFTVIVGFQNSAICLAETLILYLSMRFTNYPLLAAWLFSGAHIFVDQMKNNFVYDGPIYSGTYFAPIFATWAFMWNVMRYVSFGHEWQTSLSKRNRKNSDDKMDESATEPEFEMKFGLIDFLSYVYYTPCNFASIITYPHFHEYTVVKYNKPNRDRPVIEWSRWFTQLGVIAFWYIATNILGELFMFYTIENYSNDFLLDMNGFGAGVMTWAHGQYFQGKYMFLYGLPWLMAYLDHGVELTPLPIFISRVYLYSNMWKYFDTGLYSFLKNYLYIPSSKIYNRELAGAVTFFFIWAWHGTNKGIAIWTICNFLEIIVEAVIRKSCNTESSFIHRNIKSQVSPSVWRRLEALAGAVAFTFSCGAISFFLMGYSSAMQIFPRTYLSINVFGHILAAYSCIQMVFSYENWKAGGNI